MTRPRRAGPLGVAATLALVATTVATVIAFCRVFPDWTFLGPFLVVGATMHAATAFARWQRWGIVRATLLAAVTLAIVLGLLYYRDTTAFGILPTRATWDAAWLELADSFSLFRTTVAPVPSEGGFAVGGALGIGIAAYLADAFAFRAYGRLEALVPTGLMFVTAAAVGTDRYRMPTAALWLGCAVVTVALLRAAHGEAGTAWLGGGPRARTVAIVTGAAGLAIVAGIAGTVIGPRLPGSEARAIIDTKVDTRAGGEGVNPIVDIQARLVNRTNTELFTVSTTTQTYWRLTTLSEFDGERFTPGDRAYVDTDLLDASEYPESATVRQQYRIAALGNAVVPAAADPVDVSSTEPLLFHPESGSIIREQGNLFPGLDYVVTSVIPSFSADQLRSATTTSPPDPRYLALPDDFDAEFARLAADITAAASTPYDRALALQNYFRTFTYNVNVSRGHSIRSIKAFINVREGYCEQFSVSFAALGRSLGLPTRVAVGFTPGDRDAIGVWHVRGKHTHAWPEVWFDGLGWVPFEPTPGRGVPGAEGYTGVPAQQEGGVLTDAGDTPEPAGGAPNPASPVTAQPTIPTIPIEGPGEGGTGIPGFGDEAAPTGGGGDGAGAPWALLLVVLGVPLLWAIAMPPLARLVARRRIGSSPAEQIVAGWRRATTAIGLIGAARRPNETPLEHAARAWRMTGIDEKSLHDLAQQATIATYASDRIGPDDVAVATRLASRIGRLAHDRSAWPTRLRARFDPRLAAALG